MVLIGCRGSRLVHQQTEPPACGYSNDGESNELNDAAAELMRRESDRECRRSYGFGLDESPPMSQWEMKVRKTAIDASNSSSYQKVDRPRGSDRRSRSTIG